MQKIGSATNVGFLGTTEPHWTAHAKLTSPHTSTFKLKNNTKVPYLSEVAFLFSVLLRKKPPL